MDVKWSGFVFCISFFFSILQGQFVMLQIGVDILLGWKLQRNASHHAEKRIRLSPRRSKHQHRLWLVSINMHSVFMVMNGMLLFNLINVSIINLMTLRVHMDQIRICFLCLCTDLLWHCLIVVRTCSLHVLKTLNVKTFWCREKYLQCFNKMNK